MIVVIHALRQQRVFDLRVVDNLKNHKLESLKRWKHFKKQLLNFQYWMEVQNQFSIENDSKFLVNSSVL
jgi:hypothetical protein